METWIKLDGKEFRSSSIEMIYAYANAGFSVILKSGSLVEILCSVEQYNAFVKVVTA